MNLISGDRNNGESGKRMNTEYFERAAATEGRTLLIVDDDEINREILENIFSESYAIEHAENGRQGHKIRIW